MNHVFIIAEAGVNHNGSIELAKKLVDAAADAGADAVKFQTFKAEKLVSKNTQKAAYQKENTDPSESQFDMIKKLELSDADHRVLIEYANSRKIEFLSTPFDLESLDLLSNTFKLSTIKLPSGDITNAPLLLEAARTNKQLILSTGMCTLEDIKEALGVLAFGLTSQGEPSRELFKTAFKSSEGQKKLKENVTLLHCTTEYPAPLQDVNLHSMNTLKKNFDLRIGYSDHTKGIVVPIAAVALGAMVIEKHFTLDKTLPGPDHKASLEPEELKQMVCAIREVELSLGSSVKQPAPSEIKNISIARKSLVAAKNIQKGERFTKENLTTKRPGDGINPIYYWDLLGTVADKNYEKDQRVNL